MTKQEELKVLDKIIALVKSTGNDSYLSLSFEGFEEMVRDNIENDFGSCVAMFKRHLQSDEAQIKSMREAIKRRDEEIKLLRTQVSGLKLDKDQWAAVAERLEREYAYDQDQFESLEQENESLSSLLDAAEEARSAAVDDLVRLKEENERLREAMGFETNPRDCDDYDELLDMKTDLIRLKCQLCDVMIAKGLI